jgi:hypothetical protein
MCPCKVEKPAIHSPVPSSVPKIRFCPSAVNGSAQIHQSHKKRFLFWYKKPPRLPLSETEAVHYALFVLSQALTQLLAGVLDRSLGGCQNYRAFGFTIIRHLKIFS